MLVMSLSPLLGQAIPDIAKTTEINAFLGYLWFQSVKNSRFKVAAVPAEDFLLLQNAKTSRLKVVA